MAESTLNLTRAQIKAELAVFAGASRGTAFSEAANDSRTDALLDSAVASGLRTFYQGGGYSWSFLRPNASLTLASGASTVDLPDDFGGFDGDIILPASGSTVRSPVVIELRGEPEVRAALAAAPSVTGQPRAAAQIWEKGTTLTSSQRCQLLFFPVSDQAYTIQFPFFFLAGVTSGTHPYALGGAIHAETILAAVKAAWERDQDDLKNGPQEQHFQERLAVSIDLDRRFKPAYMGPNLDRSDNVHGGRAVRWDWPTITYMGDTPV